MKKFALIGAIVAAVSFAAPAQAADAPIAYKAAPAYNWNGLYIGAHVGYGFGDASGIDIDGVVGGAQIGFNYHLSRNWVIGLETDISASGVEGVGVQQPWIWSGRARLGYAIDRNLFYGTVGIAASRLETATGTSGFIGGVYGVGLEHAYSRNWTIRLEYLYYDFGDEILGGFLGGVPVTLDMSVVRVGVNYRF